MLDEMQAALASQGLKGAEEMAWTLGHCDAVVSHIALDNHGAGVRKGFPSPIPQKMGGFLGLGVEADRPAQGQLWPSC